MATGTCPECGSWLQRDWDRLTNQNHRFLRENERLARENGLLKSQLHMSQASVNDIQSILQRKINKQAKAIRKLEEKLRVRGQQPYAETTNPNKTLDRVFGKT